MNVIKPYTLLLLVLLPLLTAAQDPSTVSLNGAWTFAIDPIKIGESQQWYANDFASSTFDKVQVPHSFSVDKRYFFYTGTAWYFKKFDAKPIVTGNRVFLKFDAVFYKAKLWLNGQAIGTHEGGYTPFEIDITNQLSAKNTLAVQVDNSWDTTTIPGAKTADTTLRPNATQMYAWMNYGGITRQVQLITRSEVFVQNMQVITDPDLKKGSARIRVVAFINNLSAKQSKHAVTVNIYREGKKINTRFAAATTNIAPGSEQQLIFETVMAAGDVKRWNQDAPYLYEAEVITGADTLRKMFGIRKLEIKGAQILLNGEPIRMGGCNRPLDYPGYGSLDPDSILQKDLVLIKSGSMELSRISHYPVSENLLNWADQHGLLIIEESGNWQMTPRQLSSQSMRAKYESQTKEMIMRDWNHPCIIAYSLGNEFQSQTSEGKAWVKDMGAFIKTMDTTRFITFASFNVWRDYVKKPEDEASQYVDFITTNVYGNHLKCLQHIHAVYPDKPVYISEFGMRLTATKKEADVIAYFKDAMIAFRQCSYLAGASVWTFNDYMSRYPGTDADGYRAWGLVTPQRELRSVYKMWQEEFAPATIELVKREKEQAIFIVKARPDFPSYTLRNYKLELGGKEFTLRVLRPGETEQVVLPLPADIKDGKITVNLIKPGGFTILSKTY